MARSLSSTWACEPLHWLSYGSGWELAGSGIVDAMQPSSTHDCFPRRASLAFLDDTSLVDSSPTKRRMDAAARAWLGLGCKGPRRRRRSWSWWWCSGGGGGGDDDHDKDTLQYLLRWTLMDTRGQADEENPKMASQVLRDKTKKGRSGQREARNDAIMLAACPRVPALVPAGLPPPHFRALTLMSKAEGRKVREPRSPWPPSDYSTTASLHHCTQNLHLDPRASLLTTTHVVVPVCVNCHSKSSPFNPRRQQAVALPRHFWTDYVTRSPLLIWPPQGTGRRVEPNRTAILQRLTELWPRSGVAKICHKCQASSLAAVD